MIFIYMEPHSLGTIPKSTYRYVYGWMLEFAEGMDDERVYIPYHRSGEGKTVYMEMHEGTSESDYESYIEDCRPRFGNGNCPMAFSPSFALKGLLGALLTYGEGECTILQITGGGNGSSVDDLGLPIVKAYLDRNGFMDPPKVLIDSIRKNEFHGRLFSPEVVDNVRSMLELISSEKVEDWYEPMDWERGFTTLGVPSPEFKGKIYQAKMSRRNYRNNPTDQTDADDPDRLGPIQSQEPEPRVLRGDGVKSVMYYLCDEQGFDDLLNGRCTDSEKILFEESPLPNLREKRVVLRVNTAAMAREGHGFREHGSKSVSADSVPTSYLSRASAHIPDHDSLKIHASLSDDAVMSLIRNGNATFKCVYSRHADMICVGDTLIIDGPEGALMASVTKKTDMDVHEKTSNGLDPDYGSENRYERMFPQEVTEPSKGAILFGILLRWNPARFLGDGGLR